MNISQDQFKLQPRVSTRRYEDRVRTDESDYLRLKTPGGSNIGNSPQSITVRGIEKGYRDKKT